jgi:hypothetical protein
MAKRRTFSAVIKDCEMQEVPANDHDKARGIHNDEGMVRLLVGTAFHPNGTEFDFEFKFHVDGDLDQYFLPDPS